ncbi:winged helix-turn-helix transcriptional regulator [Candidatus Symbiobacter mobilis]|uniref:Transcriptional regulator-like protein n=1 Tax=Candidatus Symbiobacter mobilis CR TaxID=946483 RepID=U5NAP4_9BURK|nr:winged helix-turn-helix transcriptional regulator [Candidatus Symbiobacter mobilis]AGX88467.1 transcriptional regulator-like protein [Candidatus Symbiobacter mobilis CR]
MENKENTLAIHRLLALLEARYAMRILWALADGRAQTFRLLQDSVGGVTPNTLNARLKELRAAGVITHGTGGYFLTPAGEQLVACVGTLVNLAVRWSGEGRMPNGVAAVRMGRVSCAEDKAS